MLTLLPLMCLLVLFVSSICCVKSFLSAHLTISIWMIVNSKVNPTVPYYEYACLFFGICSFNSLGRDVISHISSLPWFGRCFEVYACVYVCVLAAILAVFFFFFQSGRQLNNPLPITSSPLFFLSVFHLAVCLSFLFFPPLSVSITVSFGKWMWQPSSFQLLKWQQLQ